MEHLSDARLVRLAQGGDELAFAELYARYFGAIYDFAVRMTRDGATAAEVAQEAFQRAMRALGGRGKDAPFEGWIFAIARKVALSHGVDDPVDGWVSAAEVGFSVVDSGRLAEPADAERAQATAALVWRASTELERSQRTLLDLHLRQGLSSVDIAQVMDVRRNNAQVMIRRLRKAAEDSMRAFIVANGAAGACPALDHALAAGVDAAQAPPAIRKLVDQHLAECTACSARAEALLSPLAVFAAFAPVPPPDGLEDEVRAELLRQWPGPAGMAGGDGGDGPGTTWAFGGGTGGGRNVSRIFAGLGLAAALLLIALLVPFSPIALTRSDGEANVQAAGEETVSAVLSATAAPRPPTRTPVVIGGAIVSPTVSPGASPSPRSEVTSQPQVVAQTPTPLPATASPTATLTPTSTVVTPTIPPTRTPTPSPCSASLSPNTAIVNASQGATSFELLNGPCKATNFTVTVRGASWITIAPASGTLQPFGTVTVGLTANLTSLGEGSHSGIVRVAWAADSFFDVRVDVEKPGTPPVIEHVSAQCAGDSGIVTVDAIVSDDYGVSSVVLDYMTTSGRAVAVMVLDGGLYRVRVAGPVLSYTVVAADFAEQSTSRGGVC